MNRWKSIFLLLLFCTGCFTQSSTQKLWFSDNGKVKVLCTTGMIQDLVSAIGGDAIDCLTLIPGESDPHSYQLVKGDDEKIKRADIIFYNGLGLEHGPSVGNVLKNNPKACAVGDYIRRVRPDDIVFVGKTVDPHVWMDVALWKTAIPYIVEVLTKAYPKGRDQLQAHANKLDAYLMMVDAEIKTSLHSIPQSLRYLVTTHDAFNYFGRAYICPKSELKNNLWKERVRAPEGLAPDSQLSTADIKRLVDHIIRYGITVIFPEANVNRDSINKIADAARRKGHFVQISSKALYADSFGDEASHATNYVAMMRANAANIRDGLYRREHAR